MNEMLILIISVLIQTGPTVGNATLLEWDEPGTGAPDEYRLYCESTPGVTVDSSSVPVAVVTDVASLQWAVIGLAGQQHCVVTAAVGTAESAPSNEVEFFVIDKPTSLRVTVP